MTIARLFVHDLDILRAGTTTDRYGNVTKNWSTATTTEVRGWISMASGYEDEVAREAQISAWVVYFPPRTDVRAGDRVVWHPTDDPAQDATFEVDGPPNHAPTPRGPHHVEARLKAVTG